MILPPFERFPTLAAQLRAILKMVDHIGLQPNHRQVARPPDRQQPKGSKLPKGNLPRPRAIVPAVSAPELKPERTSKFMSILRRFLRWSLRR